MGLAIRRIAFAIGLSAAFVADAPAAPAFTPAEQTAIALLEQPRFQPPQGWVWGKFRNADGANLRYGHTALSATAHGSIIIVPGYRSPAEEFFETIRVFEARGFNVWILDRRGQGGSDRWLAPSQKAYSEGFDHDENDLVQFATHVVTHPKTQPLFFVAESLGGHLTLRVLHDHPGIVRAEAISSPAIVPHTGKHQGDSPTWFMRAVARAAVMFGFGESYALGQHDWRFNPKAGGPDDPAKDDPVRARANEAWFLKDPGLREGGATWRLVVETFRSSDLETSPGWMSAIGTPVLMGVAPEDQLSVAGQEIAACHAMKHCTLLVYPHARHALFNDSDATRTPFLHAVEDFLLKQLH